MRFHIIRSLYNPRYKLVDAVKSNLTVQQDYLINDNGIVTRSISASDDFMELLNDLIDLKLKELENKLMEELRYVK